MKAIDAKQLSKLNRTKMKISQTQSLDLKLHRRELNIVKRYNLFLNYSRLDNVLEFNLKIKTSPQACTIYKPQTAIVSMEYVHVSVQVAYEHRADRVQ